MTTHFQKRVFFLVSRIPKGKVATYGEMARCLKSGPRAVGQALGANPSLVKIPCHRVVKSDGSLGGYAGGIKKKVALLKKEGIKIKEGKVINFDKVIYKFQKLKVRN